MQNRGDAQGGRGYEIDQDPMHGVIAMGHLHIHDSSVGVMSGGPIIEESVRWRVEALRTPGTQGLSGPNGVGSVRAFSKRIGPLKKSERMIGGMRGRAGMRSVSGTDARRDRHEPSLQSWHECGCIACLDRRSSKS